MGELVDVSKIGDEGEQAPAPQPAAPAKKAEGRIVADIADLLRSGKSRDGAKLLLREMGYTFEEAESIVSKAESEVYAKKTTTINFPLLFLGFIAGLAILGAVALVITSVSGGPVDCKDDAFCVQKIIDCTPGKYSSTYRSVTMWYQVENHGRYCQAFVKVSKSSSAQFQEGMSMNCLYPIEGNKTNMAANQTQCDGSLAAAMRRA